MKMNKKEIQEAILKPKKKISPWTKWLANKNICTKHYWKLKELFGDSFKVGGSEHCGYVLRTVRVKFLNEWDTIIVTDNFSDKVQEEAREEMEKIWKEYYHTFISNVQNGNLTDLKNIYRLIY